jgi:hypothetical protein
MRSLWGVFENIVGTVPAGRQSGARVTCVRAFLLMACLSTGLFAQTSSITGGVTDPAGAVIPNAAITLHNQATGAERTAAADAQGSYTITQVAPGLYTVTAKAPGFADVVVNRV